MKRAVIGASVVAALLFPARGSVGGSAPQQVAFTPPSEGRSYRFSIERLGRWVRAVQGHEPGSSDLYVQAIARWSAEDLGGALREFRKLREALLRRGLSAHVSGWDGAVADGLRGISLTPEDAGSETIIERAAILHTDIATGAAISTGRTDVATSVPAAGMHFGMAGACVDYLRSELPADPFIRQWHVTVAAFLQWRHEVDTAPKFLAGAVSLFPSDPDLLMIQGFVHEYVASPRLLGALDMRQYDKRPPEEHLRLAEQAYRKASAQGVKSAELALRLGRVVGLLGRHEEALSYLTPALALPADQTVKYFLFLFSGQEEAALGHERQARAAYLRAQSFFPSASSAYLALGHLALQAGDTARAVAMTERMLRENERVDPWLDYYEAGHRGLAVRMLFELRKPFMKAGGQ